MRVACDGCVCVSVLTQKKIPFFFLDPVLLCNDLGTKRDPKNPGAVVKSNGHGSISVKEAVRVAQSNNFMGLVCNSRLLVSFSSSSSSSPYSSPLPAMPNYTLFYQYIIIL